MYEMVKQEKANMCDQSLNLSASCEVSKIKTISNKIPPITNLPRIKGMCSAGHGKLAKD